MCNRFKNDWETERLAHRLLAKPVDNLPVQREFFPGDAVPTLLRGPTGDRLIIPMQFGFATKETAPEPFVRGKSPVNARVENVDGWMWRKSLRCQRCVIPLTHFHEFCYWGDAAGQEVQFHSPDDDLLLAAGLYRVWRDTTKRTKHRVQIYTMALLMQPACDYIDAHGHTRQPIFVEDRASEDSESLLDKWLTYDSVEADVALDALRAIAVTPELTHTKVRDMNPGWDKKVKANQTKRDEQAAEISARGRVF